MNILIVTDANIFIDLLNIDLLDSFFKLSFEIHTTDLVLSEVIEPDPSTIEYFIKKGKLRVKGFTYNEMLVLNKLVLKNKGLSPQDCSCIYLSQELPAILLTGDNQLRKAARKYKVDVHGILWLLDQLIFQKVISPKATIKKLDELRKTNIRLPKNECNKCIKKWSQKITL